MRKIQPQTNLAIIGRVQAVRADALVLKTLAKPDARSRACITFTGAKKQDALRSEDGFQPLRHIRIGMRLRRFGVPECIYGKA